MSPFLFRHRSSLHWNFSAHWKQRWCCWKAREMSVSRGQEFFGFFSLVAVEMTWSTTLESARLQFQASRRWKWPKASRRTATSTRCAPSLWFRPNRRRRFANPTSGRPNSSISSLGTDSHRVLISYNHQPSSSLSVLFKISNHSG